MSAVLMLSVVGRLVISVGVCFSFVSKRDGGDIFVRFLDSLPGFCDYFRVSVPDDISYFMNGLIAIPYSLIKSLQFVLCISDFSGSIKVWNVLVSIRFGIMFKLAFSMYEWSPSWIFLERLTVLWLNT